MQLIVLIDELKVSLCQPVGKENLRHRFLTVRGEKHLQGYEGECDDGEEENTPVSAKNTLHRISAPFLRGAMRCWKRHTGRRHCRKIRRSFYKNIKDSPGYLVTPGEPAP
jgi:hypothetical protein